MRALRRVVVLTREPRDNAKLREALDGLDAEVVEYACIGIAPVPVDDAVRARLVDRGYDAAIFASRNAVDTLLSQCPAPPPARVIAIGPSTAAALEERGWPVTATPSEARAEVAIRELERLVPSASRVLCARGDIGTDAIADALRKRGANVDEAVVYRTVDPIVTPLPLDGRPTLLVFASPSAVRHFAAHHALTPELEVLAIGLSTAAAAREAGFVPQVAREPSVEALAGAIRAWVSLG